MPSSRSFCSISGMESVPAKPISQNKYQATTKSGLPLLEGTGYTFAPAASKTLLRLSHSGFCASVEADMIQGARPNPEL